MDIVLELSEHADIFKEAIISALNKHVQLKWRHYNYPKLM